MRTLTVLIDDLFELARIDAGALHTRAGRRAARRCRSRVPARGRGRGAAQRHIRLAADVDEAVHAASHRDEVERVLLNLLANALRHTPYDGSVAVRVETRRRRWASPWRTRAKGWAQTLARECSTGSGAATPRAPHAGQGWVSRSRAASSRRRVEGSGQRNPPRRRSARQFHAAGRVDPRLRLPLPRHGDGSRPPPADRDGRRGVGSRDKHSPTPTPPGGLPGPLWKR